MAQDSRPAGHSSAALIRWQGRPGAFPVVLLRHVDLSELATAIFRIAVGASCVMTIVALGAWDPAPVALPTLLIAGWLCTAALLRTIDLAVAEPKRVLASLPSIPLRFGGPTGRFAVRVRDRHRVEVLADTHVVATLISRDDDHEVAVYDVPPEGSPDLEELGTAVGQAISIAAAMERACDDAPRSTARAGFGHVVQAALTALGLLGTR